MSDLMLDVGSANELKMAFRRADWTEGDIKRLGEGDWAAKILPILRGNAIIQTIKHVIYLAGDCMPKAWKKEGWKVNRHVGNGTLELDPSRLKLHFSPNQLDGKVIKGTDLRDELKAQNIPVLNGCVLDYLLANPELIPEDWKQDENGNTRYIYFWDTEYSNPSGNVYVRCLYWGEGAWYWSYVWLDRGWDSQYPAATLASI